MRRGEERKQREGRDKGREHRKASAEKLIRERLKIQDRWAEREKFMLVEKKKTDR